MEMKPRLYLAVLCAIVSFAEGKSVTQVACQDYVRFCALAGKDENAFINFRRSGPIQSMMEHVSYGMGIQFLEKIEREYPLIINRFAQISAQDRVGNPIPCDFPLIGSIAPTTLRYLKIAGDLVSLFPQLAQMNILEIGGGYGGQCKMVYDTAGFASYTNVDLPECLALFSKYLKVFEISPLACISHDELDQLRTYDLVISNYALSEIDREEQAGYLEKIRSIPRGYVTYNNPTRFGLSPYTLEEFIALITREGRSIAVNPEDPLTGEGNFLVVWRPSDEMEAE